MTQRKPLPPGFELSVNGVRYIIEDCIAAGGHSFIYEVKAFSGHGHRKTVLKEYFPAKGAIRDEAGIVCPKDITPEKFISRLAELQQEAAAGGLAGNESYQVISLTDYDEQGYAVMPKHSADAVPLATLLADWDANGVPSADPFYADLGRVRYALKITASILAGLSTIHSQAELIHCDLSLKNVLWAGADQLTGENCTALFLDFGSAQKLENGQKNINSREDLPASTAYITAPELHSFPTVLSFATDIFAAGSLSAALILGSTYIDKADTVRAFGFTAVDRCKLPGRFKQELKKLLNTALAENPAERYQDAGTMLKAVQELLQKSTPKPYALACRAASPVDNFIGREMQKNRLNELLQAGKNPIFISGHGGIGKTELALEFARDHRNDYDFFCTYFRNDLAETVLSLDFNNLQTTEKETIESVSQKNIHKAPEEIEALIKAARYELRMECLAQYDADTVLIIDNFDPEDFNAIRSSKAYKDLTALPLRIIFTTRRQIENAAVVNVAELAEKDLLQLVKSYYPTEGKDDLLKDLIREVECHTLTVDIIGRTLKQGEKWGDPTPETLLALLRSHDYDSEDIKQVESDYDRNKPDAADNYAPRRILGHLQKVFRVSELSTFAHCMILSRTCLLPASGLPVKLFMAATPDNEKEFIEALEACGWLNIKGGIISMHPLVKEVCLHEPTTKPLWENTHLFCEQLAKNWQKQQTQTVLLPIIQEQLLHTLHAGLNTPSINPKGKKVMPVLTLTEVCARISQILGRYEEALKYYRQLFGILRKMENPSDLAIAAALNGCASCHIILGEMQPALAALTDALNLQRKSLPPNHADIIASLSTMSYIHQIIGNLEKSRACLQEATELSQIPSDQTNEDELVNEFRRLQMLATAHMGNEDYPKAIQYLEQALQNIPPQINPDHPDIAILVSSLGSAYSNVGDFENAEKCLLSALENQQKHLPPEHPQVLATMMMVMTFHEENDQPEKALPIYREVLDIMRKNDIFITGLNITDVLQLAAATCQNLELYDEAMSYLSEAMQIMKATDADPLELAELMTSTALLLSNTDDLEGAKNLYLKAIKIMQEEDADPTELAEAMYNLAVTYNQLNSNGEALIWFGRALGVQRLNPDADPLDTADTMAAIGRTMMRLNNCEDARDYFEQALDIYEYILPKDAPEIMSIRENLLMLEPASDLPLQ